MKNTIAEGFVTLNNPSHVDITADRAYVVIPANYTFKQKWKQVSEEGSIITLTLQESKAGWRITGCRGRNVKRINARRPSTEI